MPGSSFFHLAVLSAVIGGKSINAESQRGPMPALCKENGSQSPVNIHGAIPSNLPELNVVHEGAIIGQLANSGHVPTVTFDRGGATLRGGPLDGRYKLHRFHFRFGCESSMGSDHAMNGKAFPGELQLLFYNKKYGSFSEAVNKSDGLAAVGALLKRRRGKPNGVLKVFTDKFPLITDEGASVKVDKSDHIILEDLVPDLGPYYTYNGTLSVPPCHGPVQWIVLHKKIRVSPKQLRRFWKLKTRENDHGREEMCSGFPGPTRPSVIYKVRN